VDNVGHSAEYDIRDIGERAYRSRTRQHLTQKYISNVIGIAQSTYSSFESGGYDMPISKVITLCDVLGISIEWLIYGKKDDCE
jgi:transcriptional regulator with XRE-family HTH domain